MHRLIFVIQISKGVPIFYAPLGMLGGISLDDVLLKKAGQSLLAHPALNTNAFPLQANTFRMVFARFINT